MIIPGSALEEFSNLESDSLSTIAHPVQNLPLS
jgi:hypothetical protein